MVGLIHLVNFVIIFSSQMTLHRSLTVTHTVLFFLVLFLSSDTSICSTMAFPPFGNSDHVFVLVSIDFSSNSKWDALFHCIAYYTILMLIGMVFVIIWEIFHERIFFNSVLLLLLVSFFEWVQDGINVHIPHHKCQVKPHSSSWLHGFKLLLLLP